MNLDAIINETVDAVFKLDWKKGKRNGNVIDIRARSADEILAAYKKNPPVPLARDLAPGSTVDSNEISSYVNRAYIADDKLYPDYAKAKAAALRARANHAFVSSYDPTSLKAKILRDIAFSAEVKLAETVKDLDEQTSSLVGDGKNQVWVSGHYRTAANGERFWVAGYWRKKIIKDVLDELISNAGLQ